MRNLPNPFDPPSNCHLDTCAGSSVSFCQNRIHLFMQDAAGARIQTRRIQFKRIMKIPASNHIRSIQTLKLPEKLCISGAPLIFLQNLLLNAVNAGTTSFTIFIRRSPYDSQGSLQPHVKFPNRPSRAFRHKSILVPHIHPSISCISV